MSSGGYGDDGSGWTPRPPGHEVTPLGDVSSRAPEAYDPNLLSSPPAGAPGQVEEAVRREIEQAVSQALRRKGIGGNVVVAGSNVELHGVAAGAVSINLGDWPQQWNLLPNDLKDRRAEAAAVRLSNALNEIVGGQPRAPLGPMVGRIAGILTVLLVLGGIVWWLDSRNFFGEDGIGAEDTSPSASPTSAPEAESARVERSCEAARSRLYAGASMGVDLDGWVVELWLARAGEAGGLAGEPAVADIAAKGGSLVGATFAVEAEPLTDEALAGDSLIVRMSEGFVPPFFDSDGRHKLMDLAQRTAVAVKADHAALYARCRHLPTRDIGAWYYGSNRARATGALLYGAGAFAEPVIVDPAKYGGTTAVEVLEAHLSKLSDEDIDAVLRGEGGRWQPVDAAEGPTAIRFPLGGPTRAAQAARKIFAKLPAE